ncbi:DNA topoisomerase III [Candidatus Electronema sp. JM]|uniref:DNA topoisomerase III n=1 Tax=Candidatus Electronema sp. JM TaxID=3401571 RepID=UPI003AA869A3
MAKTLIIAEKPSVAADIVKALPGTFDRQKTHFEGEDCIVSYAIGHLVSIGFPEEIDPALQKWDLENLPILPEVFPLSVLPDSKPQFMALSKLLKRKDVDVIVNACDAGREGELIFKYIFRQVFPKPPKDKTVRRLWLQSMTLDAIKDGLRQLRDDKEMVPLEHAALCRSEADWLIGINATRALTCHNSRHGGFSKTPCGRVQTPTLSLLVKREQERLAFVPKDYWELHAQFECGSVKYPAVWIDAAFKKEQEDPDGNKKRIWDEEQAKAIAEKCLGKQAKVEEESKKVSQNASLLYDLTTLQREANSRFGFSAKNTLSLAQALYEQHKLITYPRTDSTCLPEDYLAEVKEVLASQQQWQHGRFAAEALAKGFADKNAKNKRIFNNKKVSDHFALIPTVNLPSKLDEAELKIYQMIVQRFLAIFFPAAIFDQTRRLSIVEGETFLTEGKILVEAGWKAIYGASAEPGEGGKTLEALPKKTAAICAEIEQKKLVTKPPPRFNEATLLSAMEHSGKLVEDEELAEAMKERGLGTPATRAAIIEKLLTEKYLVRELKDLVPTGKAFELIALLEARDIDVLASPELTGEWEFKLNQILKGKMTREQFMQEIRQQTATIVGKVKEGSPMRKEAAFSPVAGCRFFETDTAYESEGRRLVIRKILGGRVMRPEEIVRLIQGETVGPYADFRSKAGKPFTASLMLKDDKVSFQFPDSTDNLDLGAIKEQEPVGFSPVDQSPVFETAMAYLSESALNGDQKQGLRIGKTILERAISREHVGQLLTQGKTELIKGFISKKKRPFDAYLLMDAKGKVTFEFPPRKTKGKGGEETE